MLTLRPGGLSRTQASGALLWPQWKCGIAAMFRQWGLANGRAFASLCVAPPVPPPRPQARWGYAVLIGSEV